ncbi:MAG TPA: UvrD-helicase domain-containing protein, partial [Chthonomonadaceae bacterium]|nr:UvrD-helicase domain-containing protein [Chthonomonadaceae bacterium]
MERLFTANQRRAIDADGVDVCVAAGAGSGKTGVLVERSVRLITQSRSGRLPAELRADVDEILVITFTEKATREMKTRIVAELTRLGLMEERRLVESAYISTIHGFCSRVLQENPFEVGLDPGFSVLEDGSSRRLLRQSVESAIAEAYTSEKNEITELVATVQALRAIGEEQGDPIAMMCDAVEGVLSRIRSAGRTRAEIEAHFESGLAATAEASASLVWSLLESPIEEIRRVVSELDAARDVLTGTYRTFSDTLRSILSRVDAAGSYVDVISALHDLASQMRRSRPRGALGSDVDAAIARAIADLQSATDACAALYQTGLPDEAASAEACHRMWAMVARSWCAYEAAKRRMGRVDNEDLQAECVRLFDDWPHIRERYRRRFRYLMVDEFQDTNPLQMRLVNLLHVKQSAMLAPSEPTSAPRHGEEPDAPRNYLFIVGDVQQSIYGFRGAEPSLFRELERGYRRSGHEQYVPLNANFRSRPEILELIGTVFRQAWRGSNIEFAQQAPGTVFDASSAPPVELLLSQELSRLDYLAAEPAAIAARIRRLVEIEGHTITSHADPRHGQPVRYRDVAILLRQLTDIQRYEEALAGAGVPYFVVGGGRGYYVRQEVRDLVNVLTVIDTPLDDIALAAALRCPMAGVDLDTLYRIVDAARGRSAAESPIVESGSTETAVGSKTAQSPDKRPSLTSNPVNAEQAPGQLPLYLGMQRLLASGALPAEEHHKLALFVETIDDLRAQQDRIPLGQLLERLITRVSYDVRLLVRPNGRRRLANVRKLLQMANAEPGASVREFIRRLRDLERISDREGDAPTEEEAADVVRIHTIHGAKGLEFPVVVIADLSRSLEFPERSLFVCDPYRLAMGARVCGAPDAAYRAVDGARQEADRDESVRLLYVAMTRA